MAALLWSRDAGRHCKLFGLSFRSTDRFSIGAQSGAADCDESAIIGTVTPGGIAVIDSALIDKTCDRTDISCFYVPATTLASEQNLEGLSNIILLGKALAESQFASVDSVEQAIRKCIPPKKQHLAEPNIQAMKLGMSL